MTKEHPIGNLVLIGMATSQKQLTWCVAQSKDSKGCRRAPGCRRGSCLVLVPVQPRCHGEATYLAPYSYFQLESGENTVTPPGDPAGDIKTSIESSPETHANHVDIYFIRRMHSSRPCSGAWPAAKAGSLPRRQPDT